MGLDAIDLCMCLEERLGIKISKEEGFAVLFNTPADIHRYLIAKLKGEYREAPLLEPLYREVAKAVKRIQGRWKFTSSIDLNKRFSPANRAANWLMLGESLGIALPKLEQPQEEAFPRIPRKCDSMLSLTYWIAEHYPERVQWSPVGCERSAETAQRLWTEEEVWAVLRESIVEALGVKPEAVTPNVRMVEDLGMN
ncbi:MAG: hypothetical protein JXB10_08905 [Pirellulales bacterium]|nr:hypothetical protein [Pirellulales bacterium]